MPGMMHNRSLSLQDDVAETAQSLANYSERRWAADVAAELVRERRRTKVIRFAMCEAAAIAITVLSIIAGIYTRDADGSVDAIFRVLPVTCAIIATAVPILFFGKVRRRRRRSADSRAAEL